MFILNSLAPALELRTLGSDGPSYKGQFNFCSPTFSFKLSPELLYLFKSFKFPCFLTKASFISLISVYSIRSKETHKAKSTPAPREQPHAQKLRPIEVRKPRISVLRLVGVPDLGEMWNLNGANEQQRLFIRRNNVVTRKLQ